MSGRLARFMKLSSSDRRLLAEAFFGHAKSRFLILTVPFIKIAEGLGTMNHETASVTREENRQTIYRISWAVRAAAGKTPWASKCLVQVMTAKRMMRKRGIESTVYLGIKRKNGRDMAAHAWIRSGDVYLTQVKGKRAFTVVSVYGDETVPQAKNNRSDRPIKRTERNDA
ncbi:MAG: lasso peptide biosynthesis B2 protein [Clostridiaceae bacterium]|mgnify:FL=1|nr:lasso peptide biosynthesis B2 protein [Clostridiaceae bacterium]